MVDPVIRISLIEFTVDEEADEKFGGGTIFLQHAVLRQKIFTEM